MSRQTGRRVDARADERPPQTTTRWLGVLRRFRLLAATVFVAALAGALVLSGAGWLAHWLVVVFAGVVGVQLAIRMIVDLVGGHAGVDVLAVTAIASTLAVGETSAAMVIVLMLTGGEALEVYAGSRAQRESTALLADEPRSARVVDGETIHTVAADQVQVGDTLLVRPGQIVPVDGILESASATFDESSLTGESLPVERTGGDPVLSGALNGTAAITVTATATVADSQYMLIVALVRAATQSKSRMVRLADRYAVPFTLFAYAVAACAWIVSGSAIRFAAVLVVATPCPLLIAAPVAFLGGMNRATRRGIIVKSAAALELASRVRTVAFDKTGTLTQGRPELLSVAPAGSMSDEQLLTLAAAAEQHSTHVFAASITVAALDRALVLPEVTGGRELATQGVDAIVDGQRVRVGKRAFVADAAVAVPDFDLAHGEAAVYVGVDGRYAGALLLSDPPRPEAARTVARLRTLGIAHILIVSGDAAPTAQAVARQVGISEVHAPCLPAEKVDTIRAQPQRPIMMVGDGVNDAPVLAAADVGVAMGARGATAAAESADVVILADRLDPVADMVVIGRRTVRVALQSIWLGIALSVGLMAVAAFGQLPPLFGALSQEVVDLAAIGNALRALAAGRAPSIRRTPANGT